MKIIYLHDPKTGASELPQLEETFPMLEIVAIDLEDDFEKQFEALKALFSQISYRNYYAIVADGFGIAYASFFRNTWTKGPHPTITILLNPNYRAIKDCDTYKKIPKRVSLGYEEDCLNYKIPKSGVISRPAASTSCRSFFITSAGIHLLATLTVLTRLRLRTISIGANLLLSSAFLSRSLKS